MYKCIYRSSRIYRKKVNWSPTKQSCTINVFVIHKGTQKQTGCTLIRQKLSYRVLQKKKK